MEHYRPQDPLDLPESLPTRPWGTGEGCPPCRTPGGKQPRAGAGLLAGEIEAAAVAASDGGHGIAGGGVAVDGGEGTGGVFDDTRRVRDVHGLHGGGDLQDAGGGGVVGAGDWQTLAKTVRSLVVLLEREGWDGWASPLWVHGEGGDRVKSEESVLEDVGTLVEGGVTGRAPDGS